MTKASASALAGFRAIAILMVACSNSWSAEEPLLRFEFEQIRFAAPARLVFYAGSEEAANQVSRSVFARLKQFDRIMSDYDPDSELSKLCETAGKGESVPVSQELWDVLKASEHFAQETDGAFDISVGPVVKLWRVARRKKQLPSEAAIREALTRVDWRSIVLDESRQAVELKLKGMQLDLGGIAQGYAADEALKMLNDAGVTRALVDISGDIRVGDPPPGEPGWKIAIELLKGPNAAQGAVPTGRPRLLLLSNAAVSTSGDAYQFVEIDGVRYSHIVNPATGVGLTPSCSVTVIAPNALMADGIDTPLCVLGVEKGLEAMKKVEGAAAMFETPVDGELTVRFSDGFQKWVVE